MKKFGTEEFAKIEEAYNCGLSDCAIERETGISDTVVIRWRKANGLKSNYVKRIGMPAPYMRSNFQGCFDHNKAMQAFFAEHGAVTQEQKQEALKKRAKQVLDGRGE